MRNRTLTTIATTLLAATAAAGLGATTASADSASYAHTPSGNITCRANWSPAFGSSLVCTVANPGRTFRISAGGYAYESGYKRIAKRGRTMHYGSTYSIGDFACASTESDLTCYRNRDEGFIKLSRASSKATN